MTAPTPEPGWKHATNAIDFRSGQVFGWRENGRLWSGIVEAVDHLTLRVKVRDVLPAVIRISFDEMQKIALDLLDERAAVARLTAEVEAIEVAVRKLCPLANNEGYEDEDGDAVVYRCLNEDGDAFIETESLADAVEGMVASYDRVCEAFEAAQEEKHRLTAEVERLRGLVDRAINHGQSAQQYSDYEAWRRSWKVFRDEISLPTPAPEATETKCPDCDGEGFTVETFPDCCGYPDGEGLCCGSAVPREHQVGCERCQTTGKSAPPAPEATDA